MKVRTLIAIAALTLQSLFMTSSTAFASGFLVTVQPGANDVPIALPPTVTPQGDTWGDAENLWNIVYRDLEMTGYFNLIDKDAYIDNTDGVEPGTFNMEDWRSVHATAVAKTRIQPVEHTIQADVYIYDVHTGNKIVAKRYTAKPGDIRDVAHRIADTIVRALTGKPGFFDAQLAAVGKFSGNKEIYLLDIDGENAHNITRNGSINLSPAWSPDGSTIAWTTYKRGNPDLYTKRLKSGRTRVVSAKEGINSGATFSPDASTIVFSRSSGMQSDLYSIGSDGKGAKRLTTAPGIDVAPDYSPNGNLIAFATERSGGSQIYTKDLNTGDARRVTYAGAWNMDPVISPDGSKVAYVTRDGRFDIMVVDIDGKNPRRITQDMGDNEDPCWSPDGRYLLFSSTRNGPSQIWLSSADGRHQVPITTSSSGWYQPTWAPSVLR